jgi:predicted RND superfamily exporter protein
VTAFSKRNAAAVVAVTAALGLAGLLLALGLSPSASSDKLSAGGAAKDATAAHHRAFGDEPVVILVKGRLSRLLLMEDVQRLLGLEGCISGNLPANAKTLAPVCREFANRKPVEVVYGPGTFINDAAGRILDRVGLQQAVIQRETERAARRAMRAAKAQGLDRQAQLGAADQARSFAASELIQRVQVRTGFDTVPALNNPRFVLQLVFAPTIAAEEPKPRFAYVFPGRDEGLIQARLRPDLSAAERSRAIDMIREAVASPVFDLRFGSYVVAGDPVLRAGVADEMPNQAWILLIAAALLVGLALVLAFRARLRLMPLLLALVVVGVLFGLARLVGVSLTLGTVALLPVMVGLSAALAALFQERVDTREQPRIARVALVIGVGLVALLAAPIPAMRTFGALAIAGLALTFLAALTAGVALPLLLERVPSGPRLRARLRRPARWGGAAFAAVVRRPRRALWIALGVALVGWGLGTQIPVESELTGLAPADNRDVKAATELRETANAEGQVSVLVRGEDLTHPRAIAWMADYQGRILVRNGFSERRPCRQAELCPALAVSNIFGSLPRNERQARRAIRSLPTYFRRSVITPDRRTANVGFVLSKMSPDRRREVIDDMRSQLDPPPGVTAELAGQPVIDADTRSDLQESRWTLGLLALLLVFAVLAVIYRRVERAFVPLVPAVLATGWTALLVWALPVEMNPVSVVLGALLIAVGSGFGTLLYARYTEARAGRRAPAEALAQAWKTAGAEIAVPVVVLAAGFLALLVSDFPALEDFGVAGLTGLLLELVALMLVLPATLRVAEDGIAIDARTFSRGVRRGTRPVTAGAGRLGRAIVGRARKVSPLPRK